MMFFFLIEWDIDDVIGLYFKGWYIIFNWLLFIWLLGGVGGTILWVLFYCLEHDIIIGLGIH